MSRFVLRLAEVLPDRDAPARRQPDVNAAVITGGSAPNVVPDRCELVIDRRIVPGETDPARGAGALRTARGGHLARASRGRPDVRHRREWTEAAEAAPAVPRSQRRLVSPVAAELGTAPPDVGFTGITDARFYINDVRIPTIIIGPGSLSVAHTANEWVLVDDLVAAARIYARIFVGFLGARAR